MKKSERTRTAILAAAREQFALHPYDRVSVRAVATQARIDPAMVLRYFTNKETLFATVVDLDLHLPDLRTVAADRRGEILLRHFLELWEGEGRQTALPILLRSAATHETAAARLREVYVQQLRAMVATVAPDAEAARRAGLISSHLLGVALTRYLLRLPDVADRDPDGLVADLAPSVQRYLCGTLDSVTH
ncbi:TetR/AcrR family transcriptional regulator [Kribbella sp. CA-293567]|uniref:TetR/AcrR family transcriptional regulator n=1 Tax=Kribbella sp. CA-293567 TaxID=3002436 RepID=UPI0022DE7A4F|nr:TetR family transcriptional regulator [Kribbella sp. CA-293567]WBQ03623.1 TetR family transcriptional regulator [Kribbella sp. CA-293567]